MVAVALRGAGLPATLCLVVSVRATTIDWHIEMHTEAALQLAWRARSAILSLHGVCGGAESTVAAVSPHEAGLSLRCHPSCATARQ